MKTKPISKFPPGHIDFALTFDENKCCVACGRIPRDGQWWSDVIVAPAVPHPIGGLAEICLSCVDEPEDEIIANWRQTAPRFIPIFADVPIQLVVRERCNDATLAQVIRDTFDRVPVRSRRKIMDYACSHGGSSITGKGMRFEALGRWPGMGTLVGVNMDCGHVIRLRASFVRQANNDALIEVIAHELAHTEQKAEDLYFDSSDECERDVEERLRSWGFDDGTTEDDERTMQDTFDEIIKWAEEGKAAILSGKRPSANYAVDAIFEANKAVSAVIRASDRWKGASG